MRQEAMIALLKRAFAYCWSAETSSDPEGWTPQNPAYGHCAVASLVVQAVLGGELLRYGLTGTPFEHLRSHYRNRLPDGTIVDFTEDQFGGQVPVLPEPVVRAREEVLDAVKYPKTVERYELFSKRVVEWLDKFFYKR
jgi:hypothetical protein